MNSIEEVQVFLENLADAVLIVEANSNIEFVNQAGLELFGYSNEELLAKKVSILIEPHFREQHQHLVKQYILASTPPIRMMSRPALNCITKSGNKLAVRISLTRLEISGKKYGLAIIHDHTAEQQLVTDLRHITNTDPLTMLYNRHYLETVTLRENRWFKPQETVAVLYLDLDKFKPINDQYGHDFGDQILKTVAIRMKDALRHEDLIFRVGGDEFVILINLETTDCPLKITASITEKLHYEISQPIHYENETFSVASSIGAGLYPTDFDDIEIMIKLADKAMYQAKTTQMMTSFVSDLPKTSH